MKTFVFYIRKLIHYKIFIARLSTYGYINTIHDVLVIMTCLDVHKIELTTKLLFKLDTLIKSFECQLSISNLDGYRS